MGVRKQTRGRCDQAHVSPGATASSFSASQAVGMGRSSSSSLRSQLHPRNQPISPHVLHLQRAATWASATVPPLGAYLGYRLAAACESLGCPPPPSPHFSCERCESILQVGINCSVQVREGELEKGIHTGTVNATNSAAYCCHYCFHKNWKSGVHNTYNEKTRQLTFQMNSSEVDGGTISPPFGGLHMTKVQDSPQFSNERPSSTSKKKPRRKGWVSLHELAMSKAPLSLSSRGSLLPHKNSLQQDNFATKQSSTSKSEQAPRTTLQPFSGKINGKQEDILMGKVDASVCDSMNMVTADHGIKTSSLSKELGSKIYCELVDKEVRMLETAAVDSGRLEYAQKDGDVGLMFNASEEASSVYHREGPPSEREVVELYPEGITPMNIEVSAMCQDLQPSTNNEDFRLIPEQNIRSDDAISKILVACVPRIESAVVTNSIHRVRNVQGDKNQLPIPMLDVPLPVEASVYLAKQDADKISGVSLAKQCQFDREQDVGRVNRHMATTYDYLKRSLSLACRCKNETCKLTNDVIEAAKKFHQLSSYLQSTSLKARRVAEASGMGEDAISLSTILSSIYSSPMQKKPKCFKDGLHQKVGTANKTTLLEDQKVKAPGVQKVRAIWKKRPIFRRFSRHWFMFCNQCRDGKWRLI